MPKGVTGRGFRSRLPLVATALTLVTTLTSCGLLGSEDESEPAKSSNGKLETADVKVSIMKTTDLAPFHLAMKEGFFKDEGLNIEFVDAPSGGESVGKLVSGEVDISYSSYTPFFLAESRKAAQDKGGIKLVADASSAGPNSCMVVATPDSSVKNIKDMAGKRVAVTATGTISDLLTMSTLKTNGVDHKSIKWVETPFPATSAALKGKRVDAAFVTEPGERLAVANRRDGPTSSTSRPSMERFSPCSVFQLCCTRRMRFSRMPITSCSSAMICRIALAMRSKAAARCTTEAAFSPLSPSASRSCSRRMPISRISPSCLSCSSATVTCAPSRVRTRVMLTDIRQWKQAARAHAERFAQVRPATTFIEVSRFVDPQWLVEFEVDAIIAD